MHSIRQSISIAFGTALFLLAPGAEATTVELYAPFTLGSVGDHPSYAISLTSSNWHIGSDAGAAPTASQFAAVMGSLTGLGVAASGTSAVVAGATASYGFELWTPDLAGLASDTFSVSIAGWSGAGSGVFCCGWNPLTPAINQSSYESGTLEFVAPARYLGDKSAALGGTFSFQFRALLGPPGFPITYGATGDVILTGDNGEAPPTGAPEPAGLITMAGGLALIALGRKKLCMA